MFGVDNKRTLSRLEYRSRRNMGPISQGFIFIYRGNKIARIKLSHVQMEAKLYHGGDSVGVNLECDRIYCRD